MLTHRFLPYLLASFAALPGPDAGAGAAAADREPAPARLVVLTFDDSVKSHYTVARPVLKRYGFGATFFITEGFHFATDKASYMTWEEIRALHDDGFEIGNHTGDHMGVTARTVASDGWRAASSRKALKSWGEHQASTVEMSAGPDSIRPAIVKKLSSDDAVVLTIMSMSASGNRDRTQRSHSRPPSSLKMMTNDPMPAARKLSITRSISGVPATGTRGFGSVYPACRRRDPSPAAMMPPRMIRA